MTFNVHARGTGPGCPDYRFDEEDLPHGDEWNLSSMETALLSRAGARATSSPTGSALVTALRTVQAIEYFHLLHTSFTVNLATHGGELFISIHHRHWYRPDSGGARRFHFAQGQDHLPVMREICRFLVDHEMNRVVPMLKLMEIGGEFGRQLSGTGFHLTINFYD